MAVVSLEEVSDEGTEGSVEPFPIPRLDRIKNPKKALMPNYKPKPETFNPDLFQLFFSLVNFHLKPYELNPAQEFSAALETFCTAFDDETESGEKKQDVDPNSPECVVARNQIVRKFLLECQSQFFDLTSNPSLTKLAVLHNELFYASEVMRHHNPNPEMMNFCDMLMADTLDLYNSVIGKKINDEFWGAGKSAEELTNDLLKKEIVTIRNLNRETFQKMSQCAINRALEKAPSAQAGKIKQWAVQNDIITDNEK